MALVAAVAWPWRHPGGGPGGAGRAVVGRRRQGGCGAQGGVGDGGVCWAISADLAVKTKRQPGWTRWSRQQSAA